MICAQSAITAPPQKTAIAITVMLNWNHRDARAGPISQQSMPLIEDTLSAFSEMAGALSRRDYSGVILTVYLNGILSTSILILTV